jgi:hypothetical protein
MKKLLILSLLLIAMPSIAKPLLKFETPFIAAAPPGVKTMAAYLTIVNTGRKDIEITGIDSDGFESAEFHRSVIENDIARMKKLDKLIVPAKSSLALTTGGLHIMLINPQRPVLPGELVIIRFTEAGGAEHNLAVKVKFADSADHHHHHH